MISKYRVKKASKAMGSLHQYLKKFQKQYASKNTSGIVP
jgi:hypothetical protein